MKILLRLALVAAIALGALAQSELRGLSGPGGVQFVEQIGTPSVTAAAGKPGRVELRFRVVPGDHINSSQPRSELLIPTKLRLMPPTDVGVGKIEYPAGQDLAFPFSPDEKLNVYTGEFVISAAVSAQRTAVPGNYRVHGELRYQACNDRACFPPKTLPVAFDVRVGRTSLKAPADPNAPKRKNPAQSPHIHR